VISDNGSMVISIGKTALNGDARKYPARALAVLWREHCCPIQIHLAYFGSNRCHTPRISKRASRPFLLLLALVADVALGSEDKWQGSFVLPSPVNKFSATMKPMECGYREQTSHQRAYNERLRQLPLSRPGFCLTAGDRLAPVWVTPWIACEQVAPGSDWMSAVNRALHAADVIIGILSKASAGSSMVMGEWFYALDNKKPFIPVRLESCPAPYPFNVIQYIDCSMDEAAGFALLEKGLQLPKTVDFERPVIDERSSARTIASAKRPWDQPYCHAPEGV